MVDAMRAITFNNALIASRLCEKNPKLVIRKVEGLDFETRFYMAYADWQASSETKTLLEETFSSTADRAVI